MSKTNEYRVTQMVGGVFIPYHFEVEYNENPNLEHFLSDLSLIMYKRDEFTKRLIPECVDGDDYVFLNPVYEYIYKPNIEDVERCYYTHTGIPEHLYKFYRGVVVIDNIDANISNPGKPYFLHYLNLSTSLISIKSNYNTKEL